MNTSLCDENGYPSETGLELLAEWNVAIEDVPTLLKIIEKMWSGKKGWFILSGNRVQHLELNTGGLPGNEAIITALKRNKLFWGRYWRTNKNGQRYFFSIRPMRLSFEGEVTSKIKRKWNYKAPSINKASKMQ